MIKPAAHSSILAPDLSDRVVELYAPLVKRIAYQLMSRLPASVQVDDLIQAGLIGLLEAYQNYDTSKGARFEGYASIRIRGAMLDEIRKNDWVPRSVHRNFRKIETATHQLEHQKGSEVRGTEVASALKIDLKEYHQMVLAHVGGHLVAMDDIDLKGELLTSGLSDALLNPFEDLMEEGFREALAYTIAHLPERERTVLTLYYEQDLNLREIGVTLGVTESRVCQIHARAMERIQSRLRDWLV